MSSRRSEETRLPILLPNFLSNSLFSSLRSRTRQSAEGVTAGSMQDCRLRGAPRASK